MTRNILITRPNEQGQELSAFLKAQGFSPFIEPLFVVEKVTIPKIEKAFSAAIITSSNACQALDLIGFDRATKIFTIGKKTAEELRNFGFKNIILSPENSAESLAKIIEQEVGKILYLRGSTISFDFAERFKNISEIIAYKTQARESFSTEFLEFSKKNSCDQVLIFSRNSAEIFFNLAIKHNLLEYFSGSQIFCLSEKIQKRTAELAKEFNFKKIANFSENKLLKNFYE